MSTDRDRFPDGEIRIGIVGAGAIAQAHAQAIAEAPGTTLTAVADVRADAAAAFVESHGGVAYDNHRALLDSGECDAIIVCTPPVDHAAICRDAFKHGIHVLCEKPLTLALETARELVDAARDHDVVFTMASKFRHVPDVIAARSLVASGALGEIQMLENAFTGEVDMSARWNADPARSGGGVLMDNGTHSLDIVRYILGPITQVQVMEGKRFQNLAVEDTVCVFARTADDAMVSVDLSWSVNKGLDDFLVIHGSRGTVRVGWKRSCWRLSAQADWTPLGDGYDKFVAFRLQLENFCDALHGTDELRISAEAALASVQVMQAAQTSLRAGGWVSVADTLVSAGTPGSIANADQIVPNGAARGVANGRSLTPSAS